MYDFCTPKLQEKLLITRRKFKEAEDKKLVCDSCLAVIAISTDYEWDLHF